MTRGWAALKWRLFQHRNKSAPRLKPLLLISNHRLSPLNVATELSGVKTSDIQTADLVSKVFAGAVGEGVTWTHLRVAFSPIRCLHLPQEFTVLLRVQQ